MQEQRLTRSGSLMVSFARQVSSASVTEEEERDALAASAAATAAAPPVVGASPPVLPFNTAWLIVVRVSRMFADVRANAEADASSDKS